MHYLRIDGLDYPVAPESWTDENNNLNETAQLVDGSEINITKPDGLHSYTMDIRLPDDEYPWTYEWQEPDVFVTALKELKSSKKSFDLMIVRDDGSSFADTVTLESISIEESNEFITASCTFKQYVDYTTQNVGITTASAKATTKKPKKSSYTVKSGDTLKGISKKMYGTQNYASKIYSWNKSAIEKAAKKHDKKSSSKGKYIYKGTKLSLKTIK